MERVTLLTLTLVTLILVVLALIAHPSLVERHVNPEQLQWRPPAGLEMLKLYALILGLAGEFKFNESLGNLTLLNEITLPENLRYVLSRVNSLLHETLTALNETKAYIDIAWGYFNKSSYIEARMWADKAEISLRRAEISYLTLRDAARQISMLGVPVDKSTEELASIENAIGKLKWELEELRSSLAGVTEIEETMLAITVNTTRVKVGDSIEIKGLLVDSRGSPLANRTVIVHVGSQTMGVVTSSNGSFKLVTRIGEYRSPIVVYAEFIPLGGDRFKYSYARSVNVTIEVLYITPRLEVKLSKTRLLPLDEVVLVVESEPQACIKVTSMLHNETRCLGERGVTEFKFKIGAEVMEGNYAIGVSVIPHGIMGPASRIVTIEVYRLNPSYSIKAPSWVITGVPSRLSIEVNVTSKLQVCILNVGCSVSEGLSHVYNLYIPIVYLSDKAFLLIDIQPLDPRFKHSIVELQIKVYNPLLIATPTLLILVVTMISVTTIARLIEGSRRVGRNVRREEGGGGEVTGLNLEVRGLALILEELSKLTRILYGVGLEASDTLREYLAKLPKTMGPIRMILEEALYKLERALYGKPEIYGNLLEEARRLIVRVIEVLRGVVR